MISYLRHGSARELEQQLLLSRFVSWAKDSSSRVNALSLLVNPAVGAKKGLQCRLLVDLPFV